MIVNIVGSDDLGAYIMDRRNKEAQEEWKKRNPSPDEVFKKLIQPSKESK